MRISEVINQLQGIKEQHGDLVCCAEDGSDPSDPTPVIDVRVMPMERVRNYWEKGAEKHAVYFYSE